MSNVDLTTIGQARHAMVEDTQKALAEARAIQSVLVGLLVALGRRGQSQMIMETFDLAAAGFAAGTAGNDEVTCPETAHALQVIDRMRQAVVRHRPPRKTA